MIFDSHAHYDDEAFEADREQVLMGLAAAGVGTVVNVGASVRSTYASVMLAKQYDFIYCSVGIHPSEVCTNTRLTQDGTLTKLEQAEPVSDEAFAWMEEQARTNPKVVAIGECGFDYHWLPSKDEDLAAIYETDAKMKAMQWDYFAKQVALAKRVQKPLIIHSREAAQDTYQLMKECEAGQAGGVVHCFSYAVEEARKYLDMGFYIGIGGVLTFKNAQKLRQVCEYVPIERILLETDCPYMAPEPHRGTRNDSSLLPNVVRAMATIKGLPTTEIVRITAQNARRMYGIQE